MSITTVGCPKSNNSSNNLILNKYGLSHSERNGITGIPRIGQLWHHGDALCVVKAFPLALWQVCRKTLSCGRVSYSSPYLNHFYRCSFEKVCNDPVKLSKNNLPTAWVVTQSTKLSDLAASSDDG